MASHKDWSDAHLKQARSDLEVYEFLKSEKGLPHCHELHYIQMATEKLSKAAMYQDNPSHAGPIKTHKTFLKFLKIAERAPSLKKRFQMSASQWRAHLKSLRTVAFEIQKLAPAVAGNGPNSEYPWEDHTGTVFFPAGHNFRIHIILSKPKGRSLLKFVKLISREFPSLF